MYRQSWRDILRWSGQLCSRSINIEQALTLKFLRDLDDKVQKLQEEAEQKSKKALQADGTLVQLQSLADEKVCDKF